MMGDRQPRPLIVPGHGADPPARRRQDELRGDHAHGLEGHAPHGAGLGVGAEPVRHIAENLGVFREFHFVEARQLAGIDRRLAWAMNCVTVEILGAARMPQYACTAHN